MPNTENAKIPWNLLKNVVWAISLVAVLVTNWVRTDLTVKNLEVRVQKVEEIEPAVLKNDIDHLQKNQTDIKKIVDDIYVLVLKSSR